MNYWCDIILTSLFFAYLTSSSVTYANWLGRGGIVRLIPKWENTKKPRNCYIVWLVFLWLDCVVAALLLIVIDKDILLLITIILLVNFIIKGIATIALEHIVFRKYYRGENKISLYEFKKKLFDEDKKNKNKEIQAEKKMLDGENKPEETYEEQAERLKSLLPSGVEWQDAPTSDKDNSGGEEDET